MIMFETAQPCAGVDAARPPCLHMRRHGRGATQGGCWAREELLI